MLPATGQVSQTVAFMAGTDGDRVLTETLDCGFNGGARIRVFTGIPVFVAPPSRGIEIGIGAMKEPSRRLAQVEAMCYAAGDILVNLSMARKQLPTLRSRSRNNFVVFRISSSSIQEQPSSSATITTETATDNETRTRLIAQNLPWTCTSEDVRNLFQKYGTVTDVEVSMYDKIRNRGLAFITMGSPDEAVAALTNLDGYEFGGRAIKVAYSRSLKKKRSVRPEPVVKHNVFVGNLSMRVRSRELREFFSSGSGNLVSAQVIYQSKPRKSTGYGFVGFSSKEEAEAAVTAFNGKILMGRPVRLALSKLGLKEASEEVSQTEERTTKVNGDEGVPETAEEI
ncbi:hypothetical protein NE237_018492 [Protea cynaroides]|uniref:RRM domain-containing protein n=1 Tax=Protea cynaroides TaxID=273540 RepID=A0A9Q0QP26_9MAGN|nr:hypothetical protein NE237_018492 [Protea cynaroides]